MLEPLPTIRSPEKPELAFARELDVRTAFRWLAAGSKGLRDNPVPSLAFGSALVVLTYGTLWALSVTRQLYLSLPAVAGFLIIGPFLALGFYEKSRLLEQCKAISLRKIVLVRPALLGNLAYAGQILGLLVLLWLRAAGLLNALFFGRRRCRWPVCGLCLCA